MTELDRPPARFQRFERVQIIASPHGDRLVGEVGAVIWADAPWQDRRTRLWKEWAYCVAFPHMNRCASFLESSLSPTGEFDPESAHRGTRHEISFDTLLCDDMGSTVEGSYRLPGHLWQIFLFSHEDVPDLTWHLGIWQSGITGIEFHVPPGMVISPDFILRAMSEALSAPAWEVVEGPDSLLLK
jgi:hypothetical protein